MTVPCKIEQFRVFLLKAFTEVGDPNEFRDTLDIDLRCNMRLSLNGLTKLYRLCRSILLLKLFEFEKIDD